MESNQISKTSGTLLPTSRTGKVILSTIAWISVIFPRSLFKCNWSKYFHLRICSARWHDQRPRIYLEIDQSRASNPVPKHPSLLLRDDWYSAPIQRSLILETLTNQGKSRNWWAYTNQQWVAVFIFSLEKSRYAPSIWWYQYQSTCVFCGLHVLSRRSPASP